MYKIKGVDIISVMVIAYVLYLMFFNNSIKKDIKKTKKSNEKFNDLYGKHNNNTYADDILDDIVSWDDTYSYGNVTREIVNPNFLNNQFHNDYRDVITALNNLVPDKKQLFNLPNIPVIYSEPEASEVRNMIRDFIAVLNTNLKTEVPSYRNPNSGWDEGIH